MRVKFVFTLLTLVIRHCASEVPKGCKWSSLEQEEQTVCYAQQNSEHLVCNRNSSIHISQIGYVAQKCQDNENCCDRTSSAEFYNIWTCPNNMEVYRGVIRWALEECSQKRYCVLDSRPGSPLITLRNATRIGDKNGTSLITEFECITDDTFVSLCKEESVSDSSVHVNLPALVKDNHFNYQCKCDLESPGNITVTLMDVRLGAQPGNQLIFQDRSGTVRPIYKGGHQFYFNEVFSPGEHIISQLRLSVTASLSPESIFLKVEASSSSNVKVTCYDTERKADENNLLGNHSFYTAPLPYITFVAGCFVAALVVGVIVFIKKRRSRKKAVSVEHANKEGTPRRTPMDDIIVDPLYSVAEPPSKRSGGSCHNTSTLSKTYEDIPIVLTEPTAPVLPTRAGSTKYLEQYKIKSENAIQTSPDEETTVV